MDQAAWPPFPAYTKAERIADGCIHVAGLLGGLAAAVWLVLRVLERGAAHAALAPVLVYLAGLLGMLSASASYNLAPPGRLKMRLRRLDHGMIFVMIAGSYTPFTLLALPRGIGVTLCAVIWFLAAIGIALRLRRPHAERTALALYLAMGWLVVAVLPVLLVSTPLTIVALLVGGGSVYSLGSFVHTRKTLPFANAIWHALVVLAAALHLAAVALAADHAAGSVRSMRSSVSAGLP